MSTDRILLVDDEPQIARWLLPSLRAAGYDVEAVASGGEALEAMAGDPRDLILLDLGLPDQDGKDVIARLREWSDAPIVVISARDQEAEKVAALDAGADDYVNKPVGIDELLARIRAALRGRARRLAQQASIRVGDLEVNLAARRVTVMGEEVRLTPREYDLLRVMARNAGSVLTHAQIITAVWGGAHESEAQHVRVLMAQLRGKIEEDPSNPRWLLTETGIGYRLRADD